MQPSVRKRPRHLPLIYLALAAFPSHPPGMQVFKPRAPVLRLMKTVGGVMLVVALCAVVGSVQNIIESWTTFTFFS